MKRVLFIKLGFCETLVNEEGFVPSLGDVFRHTVLLHRYKDDWVTWLTSASAYPLLEDNPYIDELVVYDEDDVDRLKACRFDEVLCFEKARSLCELADSITANARKGFTWEKDSAYARPGAESAMEVSNGKDPFVPLQAMLFQIAGAYWQGEEYVLGYQPTTRQENDVGLNIHVGKKWPSKAWPSRCWKKLEELCEEHGWCVSWQQGTTDLKQYMDWIHSNRTIVTCDSLGMHLGLAMGKTVIALFGPTSGRHIHMYERGVILTADWACPKLPCMQGQCPRNHECMEQLTPETVARTIANLAG